MNQLASSSSPYLQLFADSAVDWCEYDDGLFARARSERKAVHISIGRYLSTRTRVERKFYARAEVGDVLNSLYINVKIDADQRPDLERLFTVNFEPHRRRALVPMFDLYPTTLFVEPERLAVLRPSCFFNGDPYDDALQQRLYVSNTVLDWHIDNLEGDSVKEGQSSMLLSEAYRRGRLTVAATPAPSFEKLLAEAKNLRQQCIAADEKGEIKTRRLVQDLAMRLMWLWFYSDVRSRTDSKGLDIVLIGLTRWVRDVCLDHVEGGFYSPLHFSEQSRRGMGAEMKKTLEFNAWALDLLMRAVAISRDSLLTDVTRQSADFIVDRLYVKNSGFALGLHDPTNTTRLGWDRRTLRRALTEDEYLVIETLYGLDRKPNWHGRWLLRRMGSWRGVVAQFFFSNTEAESLLASGREKIRELARARESDYQVDERRLISANCAAISALLLAGRVVDEARWTDAATDALRWLLANRLEDGGLQDGSDSSAGITLVDYAFFARALLDALAHQWESTFVEALMLVVQIIKDRFYRDAKLSFGDVDVGGFLLTLPQSHQVGKFHPVDVVRRGLQVYATLFQDSDVFSMLTGLFNDITSASVAFELPNNPSADFTLEFRRGETVVVLRGPNSECGAWRDLLNKTYKPWRHVFCLPFVSTRQLPDYVPRMMSIEERQQVTAYVAHDLKQLDPISSFAELELALNTI